MRHRMIRKSAKDAFARLVFMYWKKKGLCAALINIFTLIIATGSAFALESQIHDFSSRTHQYQEKMAFYVDSPNSPGLERRRGILQCSEKKNNKPDIEGNAELKKFLDRLKRRTETHDTLESAQAAVARYRELAKKDPEEYLPDLSRSLIDLHHRLAERGRNQEALKALNEAILIEMDGLAANPQFHGRNLIDYLKILENHYKKMNKKKDALKIKEQRVTMLKNFYQKFPLQFGGKYIDELKHSIYEQLNADNHKDAIQLQKEIVKILRKLSLIHPESYLFPYDVELGNLATMLQEAGDFHQALDMIQKALLMDQMLSKKIEEEVALFLKSHNLIIKAAILSKLGKKQEALADAKTAVEIIRKLSKKNPDFFAKNLPPALDELALRLDENGKQQQALETEKEAISLYRNMARENPFHLLSLANALGNLGRIHMHAGQPAQACRSYAEALRTIALAVQKSYIPPSRTETFLDRYVQTCKMVGKQPDETLIKPIRKTLQEIRSRSENKAAVSAK